MELDSSKPNIRDEIDTPRGAIFNLSSVAQSLDGGNIRLSMLANYARSSSQARTHPVARMEATRLIIPSFLDELLRAQQRGRGEKNLLLSRRTRGRMYTEDGLEEEKGGAWANNPSYLVNQRLILGNELFIAANHSLSPVAGLFEKNRNVTWESKRCRGG